MGRHQVRRWLEDEREARRDEGDHPVGLGERERRGPELCRPVRCWTRSKSTRATVAAIRLPPSSRRNPRSSAPVGTRMDPAEIERRAVSLDGPLTPLLPAAPSSRQLPPLQLRSSNESPFGAQRRAWHCDSFIIPAAFPRALHSSRHPVEKKTAGTASAGPPPKVDLPKALLQIYEAQVASSEKQVDVNDREALEAQEQLFVVVNRYSLVNKTRVGKEPGLTLVFAHANGFHKGACLRLCS